MKTQKSADALWLKFFNKVALNQGLITNDEYRGINRRIGEMSAQKKKDGQLNVKEGEHKVNDGDP